MTDHEYTMKGLRMNDLRWFSKILVQKDIPMGSPNWEILMIAAAPSYSDLPKPKEENI